MTGFEQKGCDLQMACETIPQATNRFKYSCEICCSRGLRISCDRCAIACTHEQVCAAIRDAEEERRQKQVERLKLNKKLVSIFG